MSFPLCYGIWRLFSKPSFEAFSKIACEAITQLGARSRTRIEQETRLRIARIECVTKIELARLGSPAPETGATHGRLKSPAPSGDNVSVIAAPLLRSADLDVAENEP